MKRNGKYFTCCTLGLLCLLASTCQDPKQATPYKPNGEIQGAPYQEEAMEKALTLEEMSAIFPEKINGMDRTEIYIRKQDKTVMAVYGAHLYSISITDDYFNQQENIKAFDQAYSLLHATNENDMNFTMVRDGYRTINNQEKLTVSIRFIFKNRYLFVLNGYQDQTTYKVWRLLEMNSFRKLP